AAAVSSLARNETGPGTAAGLARVSRGPGPVLPGGDQAAPDRAGGVPGLAALGGAADARVEASAGEQRPGLDFGRPDRDGPFPPGHPHGGDWLGSEPPLSEGVAAAGRADPGAGELQRSARGELPQRGVPQRQLLAPGLDPQREAQEPVR